MKKVRANDFTNLQFWLTRQFPANLVDLAGGSAKAARMI